MSTEPTTQSAPMGEMPSSAQLILGADKRNPVFNVYRDSERERLEVYFGFEIIEALPDVPESPACKLLLARLYNAGVKVRSLTETFGFDAKTIRRWGKSLRRGDAEELIRVLEGRAHRRKCTPQIEAFVRLRLPELRAERRYGAVQRLRREIKTVFRVEISTKSLSSLIGERKGLDKRRQKVRGQQARLLLSQTLSELTLELASVTQSESRLEAMIAAQMVRMEPQSKRLLDGLRIIARNLFYQAIQPFKKAYDNFRDDHDYFRKLSHSAGVLEFKEQEVVVHLMPTSSYAPAMRRIVSGVLEGLNRLEMCFPNGAQRRLRFRLGSRSEIRLHLEVAPEKT